MSDFVLHFGESFIKIAPKITKLQLITFRVVVGFDEYFLETIFKIFLIVLKCNFPGLNDFKVN